ncbi:MAG: HIT domain-containing protein [Paludibacteraceae bacterium]|nr:HIT domain-containing protein [Paludibacteraceae bacterium]
MTIFTKIINGEIPCYKVAENDRYFAFLDIAPMTKGHTLVIPKFEADKEADYIFDMDDEMYAGLMMFAKQVAKAIEAAVPCKRVGVAVMGMEVPHVHVHLIPMNAEKDMVISNPKLKLEASEMAEIAAAIASKM